MTANLELSPDQKVPQVATACPAGWFSPRLRPSLCLSAGLLVGGAVAILSSMIGNLPSGHQFNDPILLGLSIGTLLRSLIYFNWVNFLITLGMPLLVGTASWFVLRTLARAAGRQTLTEQAQKAAKSATLIAAAPVWFAEVDAFQVFIWYGISTWLAMIAASLVARSLTRTG